MGWKEAHPGVSQLSCVGTGCSQRSNFKSVRWHKLLELRNNFQNFINMVCSLLSTSSEILLPEMGPIWSDFPFLSPFSYMLIWLDNTILFLEVKPRNWSCISMCSFLVCACNKQGPPSVSVWRTLTIHERRWNFTATAVGVLFVSHVPSGKHTKSYWKWP